MKKLNKFVAVLVALAMMAALAVTSAFALTDDEVAASKADESYLVKYLKIKEGITIPDEIFTFKFEAYKDATDATVNSDSVKVTEVPDIGNKTIKAREMTESASTKDGGALVGSLKISDILKDVKFPHAGEYIYKVTETNTAAEGSLWDYSNQTYYLHVFVKNVDGVATVDGVTVEDEQTTGEPGEETTEYNKKTITDNDPSDGEKKDDPSDDKTQDQITEADVDGFTFINEYDKNNTLDKNGAYVVSKAVAGDYADTTYAFLFTIRLGKPDSNKNATTITAYIMSTEDANAEYATSGTAKTLTLGDATQFNLKHNQKLVIPELPDETTVDVTENLNTATDLEQLNTYKASFKVTDNGTTEETATEGEAGAELLATQVTVNDNDDGANVAAYTNTSSYKPSTTGIIVSNLPYIALALVAIGGLVAYVVVRRKADDEA